MDWQTKNKIAHKKVNEKMKELRQNFPDLMEHELFQLAEDTLRKEIPELFSRVDSPSDDRLIADHKEIRVIKEPAKSDSQKQGVVEFDSFLDRVTSGYAKCFPGLKNRAN